MAQYINQKHQPQASTTNFPREVLEWEISPWKFYLGTCFIPAWHCWKNQWPGMDGDLYSHTYTKWVCTTEHLKAREYSLLFDTKWEVLSLYFHDSMLSSVSYKHNDTCSRDTVFTATLNKVLSLISFWNIDTLGCGQPLLLKFHSVHILSWARTLGCQWE